MDSGTTYKRLWYIEHFVGYRNKIVNAMWYRNQSDPDKQDFAYFDNLQQNIQEDNPGYELEAEDDFSMNCIRHFLENAPITIDGKKLDCTGFCEWYARKYCQDGYDYIIEKDFQQDAERFMRGGVTIRQLYEVQDESIRYKAFGYPSYKVLWFYADIDEAEYMNVPSCDSCYLQGVSFQERLKYETDTIHALETFKLPEWTKDKSFTDKHYYKWDVPGMRLPEKRFKTMGDLIAFNTKYHPHKSRFTPNEESVSNPPAAEPQEKPTDATGATPETEPETVAKDMPGAGVDDVQGASLETLTPEPRKIDPVNTPKAEPEPYAYQEPWEKVALEGGLIRKPEQKERDTWNKLEDKDRKNKKRLRYVVCEPIPAGTIEEVQRHSNYTFQNGESGIITLLYLFCRIRNTDLKPRNIRGVIMSGNNIIDDKTIDRGFDVANGRFTH